MPEPVEAQPDRRSLGGRVVEESLAGVGFELPAPARVALVETARPGRTPYDVVLAQNAWNVIALRELRTRLGEYPPAQWPRFLARRGVTRVNFRRAGTVVCLTDAMADLCRARARHVTTAPVTVPLDFLDPPTQAPALSSGTLLVPGTLAPYKSPGAALGFFLRHRGRLGLQGVLFAGGEDRSGCWTAVRAEAEKSGVPCERRVLDRAAMRSAYATAAAVLVPSRMESLSFPLAEALLLGREVWASRIPAHVEIAARLGREPGWTDSGEGAPVVTAPPVVDTRRFAEEWVRLGETLGLRRAHGSDGGA